MRRVLLSLLSVVAVTVAGMSLAACSSSPTTGTLTGTLEAVGGPAGVGPRPLSGQVTFHGSTGRIYTITPGANGRFSIHPAVGTYTVSGRSSQFEGGTGDCQASGPVTVTKGSTSSVEVDCQVRSGSG